MKAKFIYEKFKEHSDPIHDMDIGMYNFYNKKFEEAGEMNSIKGSLMYFGDKDHTDESFTIYLILKDIVKYKLKSTKEIVNAANGIIESRGYGKVQKIDLDLIKKALKDHLYIDLYDGVNEKFEEDTDPIEDLGIGGLPYVLNVFFKKLRYEKSASPPGFPWNCYFFLKSDHVIGVFYFYGQGTSYYAYLNDIKEIKRVSDIKHFLRANKYTPRRISKDELRKVPIFAKDQGNIDYDERRFPPIDINEN